MKYANRTLPSQTRIFYEENNLLRTSRVTGDLFGGGWHFHQEYELVLIIKSSGTTLIGDHVGTYSENDLYLFGPNLPHTFICDQNFPIPKAESLVLQFKDELLSKSFTKQPEFLHLNKLLEESKFGINFENKIGVNIRPLFKKLINSKGIDRFSLILKILDICSHQQDYKLTVSESFASEYVRPTDDKMQEIIAFIEKNYQKKIRLEEMAGIANMQVNAFCRYFKRKTKLSLFDFINRVRVGNACNLLLMKELSIQEICYRSGYNSPSNFINQFRIRTGMTPKEYREFFRSKLKQNNAAQ
jgi:AraC-like DNA-binding protein